MDIRPFWIFSLFIQPINLRMGPQILKALYPKPSPIPKVLQVHPCVSIGNCCKFQQLLVICNINLCDGKKKLKKIDKEKKN